MAETVRIQPPDGQWDTVSNLLGSDPAAVNLVWDEHGPLTASFSLPGIGPKRALHQLTSYTPLEVVAGDDPVWGGRIVETPVARSGVTVSCEGRQAELDDHAESIFYRHTRLADYQDERGFPRSYLYQAGAGWSAGGVVSADDLGITFGWSAGSTVKNAAGVGVCIDLGPTSPGLRYATLDYTVPIAIGASQQLYIRASDYGPDQQFANPGSGIADLYVVTNPPAGAVLNVGAPASTPKRYLHLFLFNGSGGDLVAGSDAMIRVDAIRIASASKYITTGLLASDVFVDAVARVPTLALGDFTATTYSIPSLGGPGDDGTPRDRIERANDYHRYRWRIDARGSATFMPQPATPTLVVNTQDDGVDYQDASMNSGRDLYSSVVVTGATASGDPVRRVRTLADSIPGRRGIVRDQTLNAQSPIFDADADLLGDLFLQAHARPPMKGTLSITGAVVEDLLTGRVLTPIEVASRAGELIRLADLTDPLTGDVGRDVQMIGSTYASGQAQLTLDEDRSRWEAIMSRMAAVQGR